MGALEAFDVLFIFAAAVFACFLIFFYFLQRSSRALPLALRRHAGNPILSPDPAHWWESQAVFNPGAVYWKGKVHLFYRAIGGDGVSRVGYAESDDGVHFKRHPTPAYDPEQESLARAAAARRPTKLSYSTLSYDTASHGSGGGWGGSEDPRAVIMEERLYLSFTSFEGWHNERIMLTSMPIEDLETKLWTWERGAFLSPPGEVQKNWLLFPEKINGAYAILHTISPSVQIEYINDLKEFDGTRFIVGSQRAASGRRGMWDARVRGAGTPPLKTPEGWLVLYHGYDPEHAEVGYKIGAMLLDLKNPKKVLYRSAEPVLEPGEWYENDWKPGVVYASGAVIVGNDLLVYYGGGDKHVAAARANLDDFLSKLTHNRHATLEPVTV